MLRDCSAKHPENILGGLLTPFVDQSGPSCPTIGALPYPDCAHRRTICDGAGRPVERKEVGSVALIIIIPHPVKLLNKAGAPWSMKTDTVHSPPPCDGAVLRRDSRQVCANARVVRLKKSARPGSGNSTSFAAFSITRGYAAPQ
jgi:hypothetical protein